MASPSFLTRPIVAIELVDEGFRVATWAAPAIAWRLQGKPQTFATIDEAREAGARVALERGFAVAMDMGAAATPSSDLKGPRK